MKKTTTLLFLLLSFLATQKLSALNNSIATIQGSSSPCTYDFRDTSGSRTYTPNYYSWNFGDGSSTVYTQHAQHAYSSNGTYTVTHISSNGSVSDTAQLVLVVSCSANKPLKAQFGYKIIDTIDTRQVYFYNHSDGKPTSFIWDFGDAAMSTSENPTHLYNSFTPQSYTVTLKVSDGTTSDSFSQTVYIRPFDSCGTFFAYFTAAPDSNCLQIKFNNMSYYKATNFTWDFGDGFTSSSMNPTHTYSNKGFYLVRLLASNSQCQDSIVDYMEVRCRTCFSVNAKIDLQIDSTTPGKAILYNYSTGIIASHYWNFGDGSTSTAASPSHTYSSPGPITLTYVVRDTGTCTDTALLNFSIDSSGNIKRGLFSFTMQVIDRTNGKVTDIQNNTSALNKICIYPNPTPDRVNFKNQCSETSLLNIYSLEGQLLSSLRIEPNGSESLDSSTWPSGLYLVKDQNGKVWKLVKE